MGFLTKSSTTTHSSSHETQDYSSNMSASAIMRYGNMNGQLNRKEDKKDEMVMKSPSSFFIQTKLAIGSPNSPFEKEADATADKVVQKLSNDSNHANSATNGSSVTSLISKKEVKEEDKKVQKKEMKEEEKKIQKKEMKEEEKKIQKKETKEEEKIQKKSEGNSTAEATSSVESSINSSKGSGSPMSSNTLGQMESSFGADFSGVRIHTDNNAMQLNKELHSQAFTHGSDIYFGSGKFDESSSSGKHLLAHELTHTIQQGKSPIVQSKQSNLLQSNTKIDSKKEDEEKGPIQKSDTMVSKKSDSMISSFSNSGNMSHSKTSSNVISFNPNTAIALSPEPVIQMDGGFLSSLLSLIGDYINNVPGWRLFTFIIGYDPVNQVQVVRSPINFIGALLSLLPLGNLVFEKLQEYNVLQNAFDYVEGQLTSLNLSWSRIQQLLSEAWDEMHILEGITYNVNVLINKFTALYNSVVSFVSSVANYFLDQIKQALLNILKNTIGRIPGYTLLTKILKVDPITGEPVQATTVEILGDFLTLIGKDEERRQMEEKGTLQKTADWIDTQIGRFMNLLGLLGNVFHRIWDAFSFETLLDPIGTIQGIVSEFTNFVGEVLSFAYDVASTVLRFIKDSLLAYLRENGARIPGYTLMTVILGRDPFTQQQVERSAVNIIRGFMGLIPGGEEKFQEIQQSGAIQRASNWIEGAIEQFGISWEFIRDLFIGLWNSFTIRDLITPIETFQRIIARFAEPIRRLVGFVFEVVKKIIEIILEIMNFPVDLVRNIISRAAASIRQIISDPIGFLKNLLRAIKQGFMQFFGNIATHLINGLVGWLTAELRDANVPQPQDLSSGGVITWVLQMLGISMEAIWQKLSEHPRIGPERVARIRSVINTLEGIWTFIKDVQERGMTAIWEKIQEQLSNLWNTVLDAIKNWVMERIITQVTTKLLSMLDPSGIMAVVNSAIAIYRAIQSFMRYVRQMLEVVNTFVNGVADIAAGNVMTAANFLENALGRAMPIVIGFLANQVGLSGVGRRIAEIIGAVREMVDRALTWLVNKAVDTGFAILDRVMSAGRAAVGAVLGWLGFRKNFADENGENHSLYFQQGTPNPELIINPAPAMLLHVYLTDYIQKNKDSSSNLVKNKVTKAQGVLEIRTEIMSLQGQYHNTQDNTVRIGIENQILAKFIAMTELLKSVMGRGKLSQLLDKYELEGLPGTYASMPKPKGDGFTADHQPQAAILEAAATLDCFNQPGVKNLKDRAFMRAARGYAINLHEIRHKEGRTYLNKGSQTKAGFLNHVNDIIASEPDFAEQRKKIVERIGFELSEDVEKMRTIANDDKYWSDINGENLNVPETEQLKKKVRNQILTGESIVASQPLENLKN